MELQSKKHKLRDKLIEKGAWKKEGHNKFDHYDYISESQYKREFNKLLSECGLELSFTTLSIQSYQTDGKMGNGRLVEVEYTLTDIESKEQEKSVIWGDALDKGDKAIYKAYTGAFKYYIANTFLIEGGDDPENDSPEGKQGQNTNTVITDKQLKRLWAIAKTHGIEVKTVTDRIAKEFKKTPQQLTRTEYDNVVARIEKVEKK